MIELAIERDDLAAERREYVRREGARRAVAARDHHLQAPGQLRMLEQVGHIALRHVRHVDVAFGAK